MIPKTLRKLVVPIDGLIPYGRNPRRGDVALIKASLERHGQYRTILVRSGSNEVLAGNHTLKAATELGWRELAATFIDVDDDEAARIVLIDNRATDVARYDARALSELLQSLDGLETEAEDGGTEGSGWSREDLGNLLADVEALGVPALDHVTANVTAHADAPRILFGSKAFYLTPEEAASFEAAVAHYQQEAEGLFGFFSWLLNGGAAALETA